MSRPSPEAYAAEGKEGEGRWVWKEEVVQRLTWCDSTTRVLPLALQCQPECLRVPVHFKLKPETRDVQVQVAIQCESSDSFTVILPN